MKKWIKGALLFGAIVVLGLGSAMADEDSERSFGSFNGVKISGPLKVELIKVETEDKCRITYESHTTHTSRLKSEVDKSGVLNIRHKASREHPDTLSMKIYYNTIESLYIDGASVSVVGTLSTRVIDMVLLSGAKLSGKVDIVDFVVEVRGSSELTLSGKSRYFDVLANSSKVDASKMRVMSADVVAESRAQVKLNVEERLVSEASMATVYYLGNPEFVRGNTSPFGGEITPIIE